MIVWSLGWREIIAADPEGLEELGSSDPSV